MSEALQLTDSLDAICTKWPAHATSIGIELPTRSLDTVARHAQYLRPSTVHSALTVASGISLIRDSLLELKDPAVRNQAEQKKYIQQIARTYLARLVLLRQHLSLEGAATFTVPGAATEGEIDAPLPDGATRQREVLMSSNDSRFAFMTFVFSVTLGLVISTFETSTSGSHHFILKFGYAVPALLLMVDMWVHYNHYHQEDKEPYRELDLFLDTLILSFMYAALSRLKADPALGDAVFASYPPPAFWWWLIAYSLVKIARCWTISRPPRRLSWYTLLHFALLALISSGILWQRASVRAPLPFWWSGAVFTAITGIYLAAVYVGGKDPLKSVRGSRLTSA